MQTKKVVTVIPEKKQDIIQDNSIELKKKKVAGYARVSTELDEQQNSYNSQLDYYTNYINSRSDWEFAGMYSDEGITGTSIKKREGFTSMIQDALDGKIDMIVTKSISRFARNTVDTLSTVRKLKNAGIEVFFEKENIYTLDSKGELLLTILSSLAQEESRSISENTTWGQRKRMADGHGCLGFSRFLGYDRGPDGEFVINEEQAKIVKRIYYEYLDGKTTVEIAKRLTRDGIKTVTGKDKWDNSTILSILKNEKYKGDCLMQKYYINDYLEKKLIKNKGELQQYYVENHHEPIVSAEVYDRVQLLMKRKSKKKKNSAARDFSSMVICGECGEVYGSKVWHSNSKYRKIIYRCNAKYEGNKCSTLAIDETRLKEIFVEAINQLLVNKKEIIDNIKYLLEIKNQNKSYAEEIRQAAVAMDKAEQVYREIINNQKVKPLPFEKYELLIKQHSQEYDKARENYNALIEDNNLHEREISKLEEFIIKFEKLENIIADYDYDLMKRTVEDMLVNADGTITVNFIGDQNIKVKI